MLLFYLTINGIEHRISNELLALENPFLPMINTFTSPKIESSSEHGGHCKISYGKVSFFASLFEYDWPPPKSLPVEVYYTGTNEASKEVLFIGTIFLTSIKDDEIEYNFFDIGNETEILETSLSYASGSENVVLPMIIGEVDHFEALRIPNTNSGKYTYHSAYLNSGFTVYDDGVDVTTNAATDDAWVTFYLNVNPVGTVTISGTSSKAENLSDFITWISGLLSLPGTTTYLNESTETKSIRKELTSQIKAIDLLDEVMQYFCCLSYYIQGGNLIVIDMDSTSGITSFNEFEIFRLSISHNAPINNVKITNVTRTPKTDPTTVVEAEIETTVFSGITYANSEIELLSNSKYPLIDQIDATKIIDVQGRPIISINIPMESPLPLPGECFSLSITTDTYINALNLNIRASSITYNIDSNEINILGDGYYNYIGVKIWMIPQQSVINGEAIPMLCVNPENGSISKHWLPSGSSTTDITYRNGCIDDNGKLWPAPYGCTDYCYFDVQTGIKKSTPHDQGVGSAFINSINITGTNYVFYVPYTSPDISRINITDLSFIDIVHSKSVTNGAYLCGVYCNEYVWMSGGSHANITRIHPTTFTLTDYAHSQGNEAFSGAVAIGTNIWWCPKKSNNVTLQDATDGSYTHYAHSYPDNTFNGVVYDGTDLWFLPGSESSSIYKFSLSTNTITTVYDSGYTKGTFNGGVYYNGYIWLSPESGISGLNSNTGMLLHLDNDVEDASNNHTITNNGVTFSTIASWGYYGIFDGSADYLTVSSGSNDFNILSNTNYIIDFRMKLDSVTAGEKKIIYAYEDSNNYWGINFYAGAGFGFTFQYRIAGVDEILSTYQNSEINDTDWHHVALVKVGVNYGFYIDGIQLAYLTSNYSTALTNPTLFIGQNGQGSGGFFGGSLDEIRVQKSNWFGALPNYTLTNTIDVQNIPYGDEGGADVIKIDLSDGSVTAYEHEVYISGGEYYIGAILST